VLDAADRWSPFIYTKSGLRVNNTYTRFKQLAINDPKYSKYILIVLAILSKLRTVEA
jgi:hypothetical protein